MGEPVRADAMVYSLWGPRGPRTPPELGEWSVLLEKGRESGGRLAAALGGAEGPEAQATALDALKRLLDWTHPYYYGERPLRHHPPTEEPAWREAEALAEEPAWRGEESLAGLLALATDEAGAVDSRDKAVRCLHVGFPKEGPRLGALWERHAEGLLSGLRPEHGLSLNRVTVCFLIGLGRVWETLPPGPLVPALARLLRVHGKQAGSSLFGELAILLDKLPLGEVLKGEGLMGVLMGRSAPGMRGFGCWETWHPQPWPELVAEEVPLGDPRVCRFLREGGALSYAPDTGFLSNCFPEGEEGPPQEGFGWQCYDLDRVLKRLCDVLAPAAVEPLVAAQRAQLLADRGCDELLRLLPLFRPTLQSLHHRPDLPARVARFLTVYTAARDSPLRRSRLPNEIRS